MQEPRAPYKEMTDPRNRNILATLTIKTIACAQRSIARARELEIPDKEERVLDFIMMTAGIDGRAREDLRDALAGARPPPAALGATPIVTARPREHGGVPHL